MMTFWKNHSPPQQWLARLALLVIICALAPLLPTYEAKAQSDDGIVGILDAEGQDTLPKGVAIRVRPLSGSPQMTAIAELFREKLEEAGYQGPTPTGYVLSFQLSGDKPKDARRSQFQLRGDGGSSSSSENVDLTMRWKATTDKTSPTRRARHLTVSLANAERNQIWQAKIVFKAADADDFTLVEAILPSLIANMGNTVYALRVP